jgi:hypothetical protein
MNEQEEIITKLRNQIAKLERDLHSTRPVEKDSLQKAKWISDMIDYVAGLAQPLPVGAGNSATIDCPHCSKAIKVTLSK